MSIAALKLRLAEITDPRPTAPGLPTGIASLDALLAGGGLPRGRLTEFVGARGSGKTSLVRAIVEHVLGTGLWVAYIDATRTLAPRDWAAVGTYPGAWIVRPTDATRAAWCADVVLRSGAFGLVVIDGAPPLARGVAVRLTQLARESNAALVALGDGLRASMLGGALRLRIERVERVERERADRLRRRWRIPRDETTGDGKPAGMPGTCALPPVTVAIEKGSNIHAVPSGAASHLSRSVEVHRAIGVARRLCADPEVPDRRGVARRDRWGRPARARPGK